MIKLICAIDQDFGIGYQNNLLFHIKKDMKFFRDSTLNSFCIMGKNTFLSLPKPLEKRTNVVLTRDKNFKSNHHNVIIEHDLAKILSVYSSSGSQDRDIYIIGGSEIYRQALPYVDIAYITFIASKAPYKDSYFPFQELIQDFKIIDSKHDCENGIHFNILTLENQKKSLSN